MTTTPITPTPPDDPGNHATAVAGARYRILRADHPGRRRGKSSLAVILSGLALSGCGVTAAGDPATPVVSRICPAGMVTVQPMAVGGVSLRVQVSGPDLVQVDVWTAFEHRRLHQQVTKNGSGANFAAWNFNSAIRRIEVTTRAGGTCEVPAAVIARAKSFK